MSWKVVCIMPDGERVSNAIRFATEKEAQASGAELLYRWMAPKSFEVEESPDEANSVWNDDSVCGYCNHPWNEHDPFATVEHEGYLGGDA